MPAKTILTLLFLISLGVMVIVYVQALPQRVSANTPGAMTEILVAAAALPSGTLLRPKDVNWQPTGNPQPGQILRSSDAVGIANAGLDQQARAEIYGAALRTGVATGEPFRRNGIVKPGDRVDVILTQTFKNDLPLARRSVSETVVQSLRVLAVDPADAKATGAGSSFGRTVTLEVTPEQAEKVNVAAELGKLSLTLRSIITAGAGVASFLPASASTASVRPTWAGDVSPALGDSARPDKAITAERLTVEIIRGSKSATVKPQ